MAEALDLRHRSALPVTIQLLPFGLGFESKRSFYCFETSKNHISSEVMCNIEFSDIDFSRFNLGFALLANPVSYCTELFLSPFPSCCIQLGVERQRGLPRGFLSSTGGTSHPQI
ncbi:hypothetical protein CEXT_86351 [Caerostris extrusa]|uniref:Uncharacterized protein n=1 Tax=Caerostris extrusa TaxID=172846 RepID=A0AAV4XNM7_CAEEX|nr:hypothetical protein CEXT_86351 [Caerostris extrusa]